MNILDRKWRLMQRDLDCIEFDEILRASVRDSENHKLQNKRSELTEKIKEKWRVNISLPEFKVKKGMTYDDPLLRNLTREDFLRPFKWWSISGELHQAVIDARVNITVIFENEKMKWYSFKDNGLAWIPMLVF